MKLLICDDDAAYVEALVKHLVSENPKLYEIRAYSTVAGMKKECGEYDLAILGEEYLKAYQEEETEDLQIKHLLFLKSQQDDDVEGIESIAKYQTMRSFKAQLIKSDRGIAPNAEQKTGEDECKLICVFSPMHHELQLPFALCLSDWCNQKQPVLFMNLEALSAQSTFMETEGHRDLLDFLYVAANRRNKPLNLEDFICETEGISYIPPMSSPTEVAYITGEQWLNCGQKVREHFHGTVVLLLDNMMQGFEQVIAECDGLILLTKPGAYYRKSMEAFRNHFLDERKFHCWIHQVALPMSAGTSMEADYDLRQMLHSKLAEAIRKELQNVAYLA